MITPYATLRTKEDLLSNSRGIDCIMDSIVSNTLTCANKCIDPFEDYYIEMSPNRAPIVGMYVKQRHLYSRIIESSKKGKWIVPNGLCETFDIYECSACNKRAVLGFKYKYCPNCGAEMEEFKE